MRTMRFIACAQQHRTQLWDKQTLSTLKIVAAEYPEAEHLKQALLSTAHDSFLRGTLLLTCCLPKHVIILANIGGLETIPYLDIMKVIQDYIDKTAKEEEVLPIDAQNCFLALPKSIRPVPSARYKLFDTIDD